MKKLLFALVAILVLSSCGSSPVNKFISLMDEMITLTTDAANAATENPAAAAKYMAQYGKITADLHKLISENKDYKITDSDREALKEFAIKLGSMVGNIPSIADFGDMDSYQTLGDLAKDMGI